jgi:hypothetical protein
MTDLMDMSDCLPRTKWDDTDPSDGTVKISLPTTELMPLPFWWQVSDESAIVTHDRDLWYLEAHHDSPRFSILHGTCKLLSAAVDVTGWPDPNADPFSFNKNFETTYNDLVDTVLAITMLSSLLIADQSLALLSITPEKVMKAAEKRGRPRPWATVTFDLKDLHLDEGCWIAHSDSKGDIKIPYDLTEIKLIQHSV